MAEQLSVVIVGRGKAGGALAASCALHGVDHTLLPGRSAVDDVRAATMARGCTMVALAVPDAAIVEVATRFGALADDDGGPLMAHLAGAHGRTLLPPGLRRGTFHVLAALAAAQPIEAGAVCAVDADTPPDLARLEALATRLGLTPVCIPEDARSRYHAGAVIAGNLATALLHLGGAELVRAGVPADAARVGLARLLRSTAERAIDSPLSTALTGPVARGDVDTVTRHLELLEGETLAVYRALTAILIRDVRVGEAPSTPWPPLPGL